MSCLRRPLRPTGSRRLQSAVVALVLGFVLAGCTGDEGDESSEPEPRESRSSEAPKSVEVTVHAGKVAGDLRPRKRKVAVKVVGSVVDKWLAAAYLEGDYPRKRFAKTKTYPGFTKGLAVRAARDRNLTSNAGIGQKIDQVTARQRIVVVDLLAPKNRIAGATARVRLMLDTDGKLERRVLVTGRVALTKVKSGRWRIFSYDLDRSITAIPDPGQRGKKKDGKKQAGKKERGKGAKR